jgi:integrase
MSAKPRYWSRRHPRLTGVHQRCQIGACDPNTRCRTHTYSWTLELPARSGKRQRHSGSGYPTAREAADARAALYARRKKLPDVDQARMTLAQWLPQWLDGREDEIRDTTLARYRQHVRDYLIPKLGHLRLVDIRGTDITRAYRELIAARAKARQAAEAANRNRPVRFGIPKPLGATTIARVHATLSGALRDAIKELGVIDRNPAANAKLPKRDRTRVQPWTPETLGRFLDATEEHRLYPVWVLAAMAGLRRGELCGLRWDDIELGDRGKLVVRRQRVVLNYQVVVHEQAKTEAGTERTVWLNKTTVQVLRRWKAQQTTERLRLGPDYHQPGTWVFTWEDGTPYHPEILSKTFARQVRRLGLPPMKMHGLRHYQISSLIAVDEELVVVSKLAGHASVAVTADIYGHLFEAKGRDAVERAAALVPRRNREVTG